MIQVKLGLKKSHRPPGLTWGFCPDPGLNRGPLDLQSNALPTELSRPTVTISDISLSISCYLNNKTNKISLQNVLR